MIIPHQANIRIIEHTADKLKVPLDKFFVNIETYGFTTHWKFTFAWYGAYI
ncbi:3-oxoacyl-[acyl-carrier-protein] synthase III C-terminal domain-containing protein [Paenibacillus farraposensis]|uniref:3-oxoacyl-[acyl-carrier-protein] synthase III C-terminal domain-containing protein n=1 Tax=Paenibacillus farraposensis TaxID=2807095 RepID=A0ABW4D9S9_9BACL|nr:3-oxoacyl-[acyl-carrier-protein] synthase III C-terminal domain-containing protein [Paenibacillus farraposensis]